MSCYQTLNLNSNSGDLKITEGNTVSLIEVIKRFSVKTPVLDFKINNGYLELYYKDESGLTVLKKVQLPNPGNNTAISVASTSSIAAVIQNGVITSNVRLSAASGNKLFINSDGLYTSGIETPITANDSTTIDFNQTDSLGHILSASVNVSGFAGNALSVRNDGLYVSATSSTPTEIRSLLSASIPLIYDSDTGNFSISQANAIGNGYISSVDWIRFDAKVTDGTALGTGINPFKQKNALNLEFRAIKGGIGTQAILSGDDILINYTYLPPTVNAGTTQTVASSLGTANLSGAVVANTGNITSQTWLFLTGPSVPVISDSGIPNPVVTALSSAGTYKFRFFGINSVGLSSSSDLLINVTSGAPTTDTIYYSAQASATPPNAGQVAAGASFTQNGALDVPINWTSFNASPLYCWAAIPALGSAYIKHKWFVDSLNQGNMGETTDLFGVGGAIPYISQVTISSVLYNVYFTNYPTQFSGICNLKNA